MSKVILPRLNQTGANEWSDVEANDVALREVVNGGLDNENIAPGANIARSKLEASAQGVAGTWYTPKVIATEETRSNEAFGKLATPDEIANVVLPENGKIRISYIAAVKHSEVTSGGRMALFLSAASVRSPVGALESEVTDNFRIYTLGSVAAGTEGPFIRGPETAVGTTPIVSQMVDVRAPAGTYVISVQFKVAVGTITAKERELCVEVHGV